jgi:hypothetical protein
LYVNYDETYIPESNTFYPYIHKRRSFAHESEYRLMSIWAPKPLEINEYKVVVRSEPDTPPTFLRESIDLKALVEAIYVSPDAPSWAAGVVTDVVHRYAPDTKVEQSDLGADPVV